jgi:hypothetical protein
MVVRNNRTIHSRTGQSNIPHPSSANNGATAHIEQPEYSSRGNRRAKQSNPSILSFLNTHTLEGSLCIP